MDPEGNQAGILVTVPEFDATRRDWYKRAVEAGKASWSSVYVLSTGQDLAIAAGRPVYDENKNLLGVVSVDLFLSQINHFLKQIKIGKTGQAFLIETSGLLVASSIDTLLNQDGSDPEPKSRIHASDSLDPVVRHAMAAWLDHQDQNQDEINGSLGFTINGQKHFLQVSRITDEYGLDWRLFLVIPESDFMSGMHEANQTTVVLIAIALAVVLIAGVFAARAITCPILLLNEAAGNISEEGIIQSFKADTRLREPKELIRSFILMSGRLQKAMAELRREIHESRLAGEALRESEKKYRNLVENAGEAIFIAQNGRISFLNSKSSKILGYPEEEIKSRIFTDFIYPDDQPMVLERHLARMKGETVPDDYEFRVVLRSGELRWVNLKAVRIEWEGKKAILNFMSDITEQKKAGEKIKGSLSEKEILLKEIHHRVKNNLQIISSLMNLQLQGIKNDEIRPLFNEAQSRIRTISLVHESLYRHENLSEIDMDGYLENLAKEIKSLFYPLSGLIRITVHAQNIRMAIEEAIPCGLIVNELMVNALKHAFLGREQGEITVCIRSGDGQKSVMTVSDNGIGLPEDIDPSNCLTLGLSLVKELVEEQLEGRWQINRSKGLSWTIEWPGSISKEKNP